MSYKEIDGNIVEMGLNFEFDVIAHGLNCFNAQKRGLAPQMVEAFRTDQYRLETLLYKGDINKMGQIESCSYYNKGKTLIVVNCYIQYAPATEQNSTPLNYHALKLCLQKLNHKFKGLKVGLPVIGGGFAGGNPNLIKTLIQNNMTACDVTVVIYKKSLIHENNGCSSNACAD